MNSAAMAPVAGELLDVDPGELIVGVNVRTDAQVTKDFERSIKARGVIEPVTAWRDDEGRLVVDRGQRRTLTAAQVGTPTGTIPVRVIARPADSDRLIDQITENIHRADMVERDLVDGIEQLTLLGVSAAQITKQTAIPRKTVTTALTVVGASAARDRFTAGALTLDEAALFAEFDGDDDAIEQLSEAAERRWSLLHVAQRIRDARAVVAALISKVEQLRGAGLPVLDLEQTPDDLHALLACHMRDSNGQKIDEDQWPSLPGAALAVHMDWTQTTTTDDEGNETTDWVRGPVGVWVVPDPEAAGVRHYSETEAGSDKSEEQIEAEAEAAREERRVVRENNAAWRAAETVRRDWLRENFLKRKNAPTGAEALIAEGILVHTYALTKALETRHRTLLELLGGKVEPYYGNAEACSAYGTGASTPKGATMRALAAVVAAWEARTSVQTWRGPSEWDSRVMGALIEWGYDASEIERTLTSS